MLIDPMGVGDAARAVELAEGIIGDHEKHLEQHTAALHFEPVDEIEMAEVVADEHADGVTVVIDEAVQCVGRSAVEDEGWPLLGRLNRT